MIRVCEQCGVRYDDLYRLTYCPHERFEMRTVCVDRDGNEHVATSLEELRYFQNLGKGSPR